ncbi:MAG: hypothetical protein Q7P63_01365 [Verrucomicrobiota bacterium JB022]|nr:hypothetical protein [Verrucomicrobiota bacterium JB022]
MKLFSPVFGWAVVGCVLVATSLGAQTKAELAAALGDASLDVSWNSSSSMKWEITSDGERDSVVKSHTGSANYGSLDLNVGLAGTGYYRVSVDVKKVGSNHETSILVGDKDSAAALRSFGYASYDWQTLEYILPAGRSLIIRYYDNTSSVSSSYMLVDNLKVEALTSVPFAEAFPGATNLKAVGDGEWGAYKIDDSYYISAFQAPATSAETLSSFEFELTGPAVHRTEVAYTKINSYSDYQRLDLQIEKNGEWQDVAMLTQSGTRPVSFQVEAGTHKFRWQLKSRYSGMHFLSLVSPEVKPASSLETYYPDLDFVHQVTSFIPLEGVTLSGKQVLESQLTNNSAENPPSSIRNSLQLKAEGPGVLTFWVQADTTSSSLQLLASEADNPSVLQKTLAANESWQLVEFPVAAGMQTITLTHFYSNYYGYTTVPRLRIADLKFVSQATTTVVDALDSMPVENIKRVRGWVGELDSAAVGGDALVQYTSQSNHNNFLEVEVTGPGTLSFRAFGSGTRCVVSFLEKSIPQDYELQVISIEFDGSWKLPEVEIPSGAYLVGIRAEPVNSGQAGYLKIDDLKFTPTTISIDTATAVDNNTLLWVDYPDNPWMVTASRTAQGGYALRSGVQPRFSASSNIATVVKGPGVLRFRYLADGRSSALTVYTKPVDRDFDWKSLGYKSASRQTSWQTMAVDVPEGMQWILFNVLRRDNSVSVTPSTVVSG